VSRAATESQIPGGRRTSNRELRTGPRVARSRRIKHLGIALVALAWPVSARADNALHGALSVGLSGGVHDHDGARAQLGADLDGELHFGMIAVGGSLGFDDYALVSSAPVRASTLAGRVGIAVPVEDRGRR
jgi:hypothetical protein